MVDLSMAMLNNQRVYYELLSSYQITISSTYKVHLLCRCHASKGRTSCPWYSARSPVNDPNVHCRNKWPEWPGARMVSWLREKSGWILLKWKLQPLSNHCKPLWTTINHYEPLFHGTHGGSQLTLISKGGAWTSCTVAEGEYSHRLSWC